MPRREMALKLRRRSVYVGTIMAILATIGGFALAGTALTFSGSTGFNTGSQTVGNTIYSGTAITASMTVQTSVPGSGSCTAGSQTPAQGAGTDTVDISDTGAACSAAGAGGELYDQLVLHASGLTALQLYKDTISIATTPASAGATVTITFSTAPVGTTETLTIWLDLGAATGNTVTNVDIGIAGN